MNIGLLLNTLQILSHFDNNTTSIENEATPVPHTKQIYRYGHAEDANCYGVLGCFPIDSPWQGPLRPIGLPPQSIKVVRPSICMHSKIKLSCQKLEYFNTSSVLQTDLSPESQILVIAHGFVHSGHRNWVKELTKGILQNSLENKTVVLTISWSLAARSPYAQAVANTRIIGALVGYVLQKLANLKGIKMENIHLIGHSLGAHLFGYTGAFLRDNFNLMVGKITGLDPAGPYFEGTPTNVRLDPSDAALVVNIHTDSPKMVPLFPPPFGINEASGHIDFYPDGGSEQRRCMNKPQNIMVTGIEGVIKYIACNHLQAIHYLILAESKRCNYIGVECSSWEKFRMGECWDCSKSLCLQIGVTVKQVITPSNTYDIKREIIVNQSFEKIFTKAYLLTHRRDNNCGRQILITLRVPEAKLLESHHISFFVSLRGETGISQLAVPGIINYGNNTIKWIDTIPDIGKLHSAVFRFTEEEINYQQAVKKDARNNLKMEQLIINYLHSGESIIFNGCKNGTFVEENYTLERTDQQLK